MRSVSFLFLIAWGIIWSSCASVRPYYESVKEGPPQSETPTSAISHSSFFVGGISLSDPSPVLNAIVKAANKNSSLVLLGEVLSIDDFPSVEDDLNASAMELSQIHSLDNSFENFFLIPGEKEWSSGEKTSSSALHDLDKRLKDVKKKGRLLIPAKDCGMPEVVRLSDHTILVMMDSQWALEAESSPGENLPGCELTSVLEMRIAIKDIIQSHPTDYILFASHHPVFANGPTAGNYPLSSHLLPVPVIGTLITGLKTLLSSNQHFGHPAYEAYRSAFLSSVEGCANCVVISGHEKSLQYFHRGAPQYLVAGSGTTFAHARKGERAGFSYMSTGYVRIDELTTGDLSLSFYALKNSAAPSLVWQKIISSPRLQNAELSETAESKSSGDQDSILLPASTRYSKKHFLRGEFYRAAWSLPVKMQVLHLDRVHGSLHALQLGGGNQTRSLRLENEAGEQYVLRSIDKKVTVVLPPALRGSFAENIVQEGIAASHPYGALVVPQLARAAGVYYTNPSVVYVPHQKALGIYDKEIGDGVYLFEERPGGKTSGFSNFGNTNKTYSTAEVIEFIAESHKHVIDQKAALRTRLFDIWLGDWDRHDDQVRWAAFEENEQVVYRPIPRDRDQVFYKNDGVLDYIGSRPYFNPPLRRFTDKIDHLDGLIWAGKYFDRSFLHELTEQDFVDVATSMQKSLTDEVIVSAFKDWPASIDSMDGPRLRHDLRVRRDDLVAYAKEYYRLISKEVFIPTTTDKDVITIDAIGDGQLKVDINRKENDQLYPQYHRVFSDDVTKEIRIFGLNRQDSLLLSGSEVSPIRILFIGGTGKDVIQNNSDHLHLIAYDENDGVEIQGDHVTRHINDRPVTNSYDRTDWNLNRSIQFLVPTYYTDEGVGIHYTRWWTRYGFRSDPFKSKHALGVSYFFGTGGMMGTYKGDWRHAIGEIDLGMHVLLSSPAFTQYWYGPGNAYRNFEEKKKYHFVEGGQVVITPSLIRRFGLGHSVTLSPSYQYINIEKEEEARFINTPESGLTAEDFGKRNYVGLTGSYHFTRIDNPSYPTRGIDMKIYGGARFSIGNTDVQHGLFGIDGSLYLPFDVTGKVVLATHFRADKIAGEYEFFHALTLSGEKRMRGFREDRFAGNARFFQSTDLQIKLFNKKGVVPFQLGVYGAFDYGRVWYESDPESADIWHTAVGGGIFLVPLGITAFRIGYMSGGDDEQITIGGALAF